MNDTTTDIETTTEAIEATVDTWLAAYCEPDTDRRTELIRQVWAPDGELVDPPLTGAGHDTLVALAGAVLAAYPDHRFRRTTPTTATPATAGPWSDPTGRRLSPASTSPSSPPTAACARWSASSRSEPSAGRA